jgi:N-acetylmuramoyl-L-alanine amidase
MGPGLEYRKIIIIPRGEQVKWLTEKNGWSQVQTNSGEIGWVKLELARDVTLPGMVANQDATVRAGPGNSYAQVGSVQQGKKYTPLKKEGGWYQLRLPTGTEGWVAMEVFTTKKSRLVFTLDKAEIRQGPGAHYAIVAHVEPAIDVNILGTEGDWYHVQLQDGKKGYIRKELVFEE